MALTPGRYDDLDETTYHQDEALGSTDIKRFFTLAPAKARHQQLEGIPDSDILTFGRIVHAYVLEGKMTATATSAKTRGSKAWKEDEAAAKEQGLHLLKLHDLEKVKAIREGIMRNPVASDLIEGAQSEVSFFADDDGVPVKARLDGIKGGIAFDLKTTADADPMVFARKSLGPYGYNMQQAHYEDVATNATGQGFEDFLFILTEKEPPYLTSVVRVSQFAVQAGLEAVLKARRIYRECLAWDNWPGFPGITPIDLPEYEYARHQERLDS